MFAVHNYQQGVQRLLAACDEDLLGKVFQEGKFRLDVTPDFYDGDRVDEAMLVALMRQCTIANLVGQATVDAAIAAELVDPANVLTVEGIPHAQMMVMLP